MARNKKSKTGTAATEKGGAGGRAAGASATTKTGAGGRSMSYPTHSPIADSQITRPADMSASITRDEKIYSCAAGRP
jgi:hypothetical protein